MIELLRTNDLVLISAVEALLTGAAIEFQIVDRHMSMLEGSIGILPRRILVAEPKLHRARKLLEDAGLSHALPAS